jgi:hypothetical protein
MADERNHGVKVKTKDHGRARWLTPGAGLNGLRLHAALFTEEGAKHTAEDLVESNPGVVEWARAEAVFS